MATYIDVSQGTALNLVSQISSASTSWRLSIKFRHTGIKEDETKFIRRSSDSFFVSVTLSPSENAGIDRDLFVVRSQGGSGNTGLKYALDSVFLDGQFHVVDFYCDGTTLFIDRDGSNVNQAAFAQPFSGWDDLVGSPRKAHLEYIKFYESSDTSALVHSWDANDSDTSNTGAQPVLIDSVAGNNATGSGFPTDGTAFGTVTSPSSLTVTQTELTPGGTISGSYSNYDTVPTTLTVSDGTNTITIPSPTISDNSDGTGTFSGTMPSLPTSGTANLILFGNVTVELT